MRSPTRYSCHVFKILRLEPQKIKPRGFKLFASLTASLFLPFSCSGQFSFHTHTRTHTHTHTHTREMFWNEQKKQNVFTYSPKNSMTGFKEELRASVQTNVNQWAQSDPGLGEWVKEAWCRNRSQPPIRGYGPPPPPISISTMPLASLSTGFAICTVGMRRGNMDRSPLCTHRSSVFTACKTTGILISTPPFRKFSKHRHFNRQWPFHKIHGSHFDLVFGRPLCCA